MPLWQDVLAGFSPGGVLGGRQKQQQIDAEKQAIQARKEALDQAAFEHAEAAGYLPVGPGGVVKRQLNNPGNPNMGSTPQGDLPSGVASLPQGVAPTGGHIIDKADPARTITHTDANGDKVMWEIPTVEEQLARQANLEYAKAMNPANRQVQQMTSEREATSAQAKARGTSLGTVQGHQQGLQEARAATGVALPEGSGMPADQKFLPEELNGVTQGVLGATQLPAQIQKAQLSQASQALGSVKELGSYKILYGQLPETLKPQFDPPDKFDPIKSPARARLAGMSPQDQQKYAPLIDMDPKEWDAKVDAAYPATGETAAQNKAARILVKGYLKRGEFDKADTIIKDGLDQQGKTVTAVASAKATAPIKIDVANRTAEARSNAAGLSDDDYARAGQEYGMTGIMPALGRDSVTRAKIVKASNEWARDNGFTPSDVVKMRAAFKGDTKSLEAFQKQRDQIVSFEQTATKNLDLFLDAASKIPDTGVPWLNKPLRSLDAGLVGSENMAAVNAARQVANNEIAKVTSGGGLSGVLSDSARKEVGEYNPANATFKQTINVAKILKQDMANRRQSMDATLEEIKGRIGNPGGTQATTPTGSVHRIRVGGKLYDYKGSGATDDMANYSEVKQ